MFKYKYSGSQEVHLPQHSILVKVGDTVVVSEPIDHPNFELVVENKKVKKEE